MSVLAFALSRYATIAFLAVVAFLFGRGSLGKRKLGSPTATVALATSLGLGEMATLIGLLGHFGALRTWVLFWFVVLAIWWGRPALRDWLAGGMRLLGAALGAARERPWILPVVVVVALLGSRLALLPLYPTTDFDASSYHLAVARAYAREHAVFPTPFLRFPVGPLNAHMLFTIALVVQADSVVANLVSFLAAGLVAMAVYAWVAEASSPRVGWLAVAFLVSNSVFWNRAETASYHMLSALTITMAVWCLARFDVTRAPAWLLLSAAFSGFAAGTYYVGLFFVGVLGLAAGWSCVKAGLTRWAPAHGVVALLVASPWLVRNAFYTGNPVWPFFGRWLGLSPWWDSADLDHVTADLALLGKSRTLVNFLRLPYDLTFQPDAFQALGASLSWAPLLSIPLIAFGASRDRRVAFLAALSGGYLLFWFHGAQALRYLLPILPLLAVAAGLSWHRLTSVPALGSWPRLRGGIQLALAMALAVPCWNYAEGLLRARGPLPLGRIEQAAWLSARVPGYAALEIANRAPGPVFSLPAPWLAAASEGGFRGDVVGPARYSRVLAHLDSGDRLYAVLRSLGARYLLLSRPGFEPAPVDDQAFAELFALRHTSGSAELFALRDERVRYDWPPPERLANPGFEEWEERPASWEAAGEPLRSAEDPFVYSGAAAVALGIRGSVSQLVQVAPGEACTLVAWARTRRAGRRLSLEVEWLDSNRAPLYLERTEREIMPRWARVLARRLAPAGAAWAGVRLASAAGQVWVDGTSFRCVAQPETRGAGAAPVPTLPVSGLELAVRDRASSR